MKKILLLALSTIASAYMSPVHADDHWYIGASYNAQKVSSFQGQDFNTAGITAGYKYNKYLSLETRLSTGTSGYSNANYSGNAGCGFAGLCDYNGPTPKASLKEDIDSQASLLFKISYPVMDSLNLYGLAGYTQSKLKTNASSPELITEDRVFEARSFKYTKSVSGLSYGIGLAYELSESFNVFIDYQVMPDYEYSSSYTVGWKSTAIGVNYAF